MKLEKQTYFYLLEDDIVYKEYKEKIDKYIKELEAQDKKDDLLVCPSEEYLSCPCPKEIEISDSEYENLKQHSEWLNKYEGDPLLTAFSFESYRDKYEKEQRKKNELRRVIERLMDSSVYDMDEKIRVLLDTVLE
jgi:hypothetical protein